MVLASISKTAKKKKANAFHAHLPPAASTPIHSREVNGLLDLTSHPTLSGARHTHPCSMTDLVVLPAVEPAWLAPDCRAPSQDWRPRKPTELGTYHTLVHASLKQRLLPLGFHFLFPRSLCPLDKHAQVPAILKSPKRKKKKQNLLPSHVRF